MASSFIKVVKMFHVNNAEKLTWISNTLRIVDNQQPELRSESLSDVFGSEICLTTKLFAR